MKALYIYNAALYNSAKDAAKEPGALFCVDGTTEPQTIGQLQDIMNTVNKCTTFIGSCFQIVCAIGDDFYSDLEEFDRELDLAALIDPPLQFSFEELRDHLPLMFDLLRDTGGKQKNPDLWIHITQVNKLLTGESLSTNQTKALKEFFDATTFKTVN